MFLLNLGVDESSAAAPTRSMSYKKRSKRWSSLDFGVFVQSFLIFHDRRGQVVSKFIFSFLVCFLKEMGTGLVSSAFSTIKW